MQVRQSLDELVCELLDCLLGKLSVLFDELEQVSAWAVLEDDPEMVASFVPVVKL